MKDLPRLELTENPNKNNEYIIFRHSVMGNKNKNKNKIMTANKIMTKKRIYKRKYGTKKIRKNTNSKKGYFDLF
jgi:hypothetical protein